MATLRDILRRINSVKSTSKITQAMKMVSAAKLNRAQRAIESARPYVLKLDEVLSDLVESVGEDYSHPLIQKPSEVNSIVVITIAGDRGLCGSFNSNIFRKTMIYINEELRAEHPDAEVSVIGVGQRAVNYFKKNDWEIIGRFGGVFDSLSFDTAKEIVNIVKPGYEEGKIDKVVVIFNEFVNVLRQLPSSLQLLPIEPQEHSEEEDIKEENFNADYIFEPDQVSILDELLPKLINIKMYRALLESNAAEQAARMMAMENATENAKELIKDLELVYNKARQAAITTEMLDIVSGANALKQ